MEPDILVALSIRVGIPLLNTFGEYYIYKEFIPFYLPANLTENLQ